MDLEDMVSLTEYPFDGLETVVNNMEEEMAESYFFFKHKKEKYKKIMGYVSAIKSLVKYLQDLRNEFRTIVNNR